jgi:hypothetical protein
MNIVNNIISIGREEMFKKIEGIPSDPTVLYKFIDREMILKVRKLPPEEYIYFIKGFALIEKELANGTWGSGSTTPIVKLLKPYPKYPLADRLKKDEVIGWLLKNRTNPYIPFGCSVPLEIDTLEKLQQSRHRDIMKI